MINTGRIRGSRGLSGRLPILAFAALLAFLMVMVSSPADGASSDPMKAAKISQAGKSLILQVRTGREINLKGLNRQPDLERRKSRYLCLEMTRAGHHLISRICLGGKRDTRHRLGITRTNRVNKIYSKDTIKATVKRASDRKLVVKLDPEEARLPHGPYSWRIVYSDGTCRQDELTCRSKYPAGHKAHYRVRKIVAVGCTGGNGQVVLHGPRRRKRIALTFDDGPSTYTPKVLRILKRYKAKATFFMLGQEVSRYPAIARRVLAQGHELANHSMHHSLLPSESDIKRTSHIIKKRTGFRPCLFRPPYGALSGGEIVAARHAKTKVVNWNVDTVDWTLPGSGSILNSASHAGRGAIVLMHDGGGNRSQTVGALSKIVRRLKHRGYELVTVSELLGNEIKYRPK
jgi:peptidoglycan/xylan/chitin deacetylase (PgdA/CDA1 family)